MNNQVFPSTRNATLPGPMPSPQDRQAAYAPVSCDFTDELEFVSVKKIPVNVSYWGDDGELKSLKGRITNILTENKEEFIELDGGERVRLDYIYEIKII